MPPDAPIAPRRAEPPALDAWEAFPLLVSIPRAAAMLGISRASAYRYAESGALPVARLGGRVYVVVSKLRAFLESA